MRLDRNALIHRLSLAAAIAILALVPAAAVADWQEEATIDIPFSFVVENTTLPAGEYTLYTDMAESNVLRIDRKDGEAGALTLTQPMSQTEEEERTIPSLVFDNVAGRRFLTEAHVPSGDHHWKITPGSDYRELLAAGVQGTVVILALPID